MINTYKTFAIILMSMMIVISSCKKEVDGCTDSSAMNYLSDATSDDGSCIFSQSDCSNLFISEYVEGPGQNNAIEIYNPTGTSVCNDDIKYLLNEVKDRAIVVVDEAYIEFSSTKSLAREINNYNNLIILRTLSKAFSLAGIRCGAIISSSESSELLKKILPPFCFATPVIEFIKNALLSKNLQSTKKQIKFIIRERERVKSELETINCVNKVWKSDGNFLLVKFKDIDSVKNSLISANIVVGLLKYPSLSDCARITIGTRDQNNKLLEILGNLH